MALYLISYDLDKPGQNYEQLINRLTPTRSQARAVLAMARHISR